MGTKGMRRVIKKRSTYKTNAPTMEIKSHKSVTFYNILTVQICKMQNAKCKIVCIKYKQKGK